MGTRHLVKKKRWTEGGKYPVPAEEKHPHNIMLPPPYFTVGMVFVEEWIVLGFRHTAFSIFAQKLPTTNPKTLSHILPGSFWCFLANSRHALMFFFFINGFFLSTLPYRPVEIVDWGTFTTQSQPLNSGAPSQWLLAYLWFPSQKSPLLALTLSFDGWPCLGNWSNSRYYFVAFFTSFACL